MVFKILGLLFAAALAVCGFGAWYVSNSLDKISAAPVKDDVLTAFTVGKSERPVDILTRIILDDSWDTRLYRLWFRFNPKYAAVKAGTFDLKGNCVKEVFESLITAKPIILNFTIVEGTRFEGIPERLAKARLVSATLGDEETLKKFFSGLKYNQANPEGQFLPDTFAYSVGESDADILMRSHKSLIDFLEEEWAIRDPEVPYKTPYEALIMASIIEKETSLAAEYPLVSAVFANRLAIGMKLQTDPTVIYGVGSRYQGTITREFLDDVNEYNTYVIDGLPPTPIAMASKKAIHYALHPSKDKYLYFVATGVGGHTFTTNLKDHNKAVAEYRKHQKAAAKARKEKAEAEAKATAQAAKEQAKSEADVQAVADSVKAEETESKEASEASSNPDGSDLGKQAPKDEAHGGKSDEDAANLQETK